MSALLSNGVDKVDSQVLSQLRTKHPPRSAPVKLPSMRVIEAERATWQQDLHVEEDLEFKHEIIPEQR